MQTQGDLEMNTGFLKLTKVCSGQPAGHCWVKRSEIRLVEPYADGDLTVYRISGLSLPYLTVLENPLEIMGQ